jgi:HK97 family phage prohead protease
MTVAAFQKRIAGINGQRIAWTSEQITRIARHYGIDAAHADLPPAAPAARRAPDLIIRDGASSDGMTATFIASTADVDRMGDTIAVDGWKLDAYRKNPVILFAHDSGSLPVGRAVSVGVQGGKLMVAVRFAQTTVARSVANMISNGFLRAVSVGFRPLAFEFAKTGTRLGGIDFTEQELLEVSVVPVPANPHALLTSMTGGDGKSVSLDPVRAKRERTLTLLKLTVPTASPAQRRAETVAGLMRRTR